MIEDRIKKLRDELNERNEEINILKGNTSKQINQIRGSITKFLDKVMETGTLGERIKTLDSIHIDCYWYGHRSSNRSSTKCPSVPATTTSGSTSGGDGKGSGGRGNG